MKSIALLLPLLLLPVTAGATVNVQDTTGTLTAAQLTELDSIASGFKVRVLLESAPGKAELEAVVAGLVDSPITIAIGVDPVHRFTATHFGVDTGIRSGDFPQVARAGNMDFKQGDWVGGVKSIVARASVLSQKTSAPAAVVVNQPVIEKPVPVWPFFLGFSVLAGIVYLAWRRNRETQESFAKTTAEFRDEAAEMRSRNIREAAWAAAVESRTVGAPVPTPPPSHVYREDAARRAYPMDLLPNKTYATRPAPTRRQGVVQQPVQQTTVVVANQGPGFTDGLLIGEALGHREPQRSRTPAPVQSEPSSSGWGSSSSSDSGGSSSSSSSYDSGGSSGDFGGGGGGFDGGGSSGGDF